jgi:hypothetical protein
MNMGLLSKVHGWSDNARNHPSISGGTGGTLGGSLKLNRQDAKNAKKRTREKKIEKSVGLPW